MKNETLNFGKFNIIIIMLYLDLKYNVNMILRNNYYRNFPLSLIDYRMKY